MIRSTSLRLSLCAAAVALGSVTIAASTETASARPHHGMSRHHTTHHFHRGLRVRHAYRGRLSARAMEANAFATQPIATYGSSNVVDEARRYLGGNPTGRGSLWCARFMNMVLERTGHRGTGSDMARSFASYGSRVSGPQVGAIAVMSRGRRGGHVGIVSGIDASGNPIVISGNNGNRVREAAISRGRIYAYVMPSS
ncbi:MAG: TIGR02594 family protein [Rhizobiales bacterium]|nr:TIGR02594 family protein [Hyphomicrobiales bacterium]